MNDHYYTQNPTSAHRPGEALVRALGLEMRFETDAGVFSRDGLDAGSRLLLESLPPLEGRVLDLGCGWGAIGVTLALKYPAAQIVLSDINARAVDLARLNIRRLGAVNARVLESDGFEAVSGDFDFIVTNPPIRAGKRVIYEMFSQANSRLRPNGRLYLVIRKQQGAPSALKYLSGLFGDARVIERGGGYWIIQCQKTGGENNAQ